jgi:hypothetical protein
MSENRPPASTAGSCRVSPTPITRAPACRASEQIRARSCVDTCEASSTTRTSPRPTGTWLAKNRAMFHASVNPSPAATRAAFSDKVRQMTRPPVSCAHAVLNAAITCVFPVPAAATRQEKNRPVVSIPVTARRCCGSRSVPASAAAARPSVTSCGTAPLEAFSRIHSSVSRCAAVANRSWPGGRYTDVPSLRWSREDTSTRSGTGAIRITPVSGIRPASASSASASRYAHQSAAAGRTGICRYSSHSRWARVQVGC